MYKKFFKRLFDLLLSVVSLILLSPIILIVAIIILVFMGRPVFFIQERPGLNEKPFKIIKFRSMTNHFDNIGKPLNDDLRLTKFGAILRATSIDELPELINILKGDMSFVGPRPLLTNYLPYYTKSERIRHTVRPGLTGLAQIRGRNHLEWDERLKLDQEYVNSLSFLSDLKIIFKTLINVIKMKDTHPLSYKVEGNLAEQRKNRHV